MQTPSEQTPKLVTAAYNGSEVTFSQEEEVYVNASEMCKPFKKKVNNFLRNAQTKAFIKALEARYANSRHGNVQFYCQNQGGLPQEQGTWMHRKLALKLAAWLNPDFELWVYEQIEAMLFTPQEPKRIYITDPKNSPEYLEAMKKQVDLMQSLQNTIKSENYFIRASSQHLKEAIILKDLLHEAYKAAEIRSPFQRGVRITEIKQELKRFYQKQLAG